MMSSRFAAIFLSFFLLASLHNPKNGTAAPRRKTAAPTPSAPVALPAGCTDLVPPLALRRSTLLRIADAGVGRFLQNVRLSVHREAGRYLGWRLDRLFPDNPCMSVLDLHPGDIVIRINRRGLQRPENAHTILQALRTDRALTIEYLRGKTPLILSIPILDDPARAPTPPHPVPPVGR